jgi:AraC-like DNA-binding protein
MTGKSRGTVLTVSWYTFTAMLHKDVLVRLCHARDLLRQTEEDNFSVPQVAREVGMSPYHFIRLFKAVFGETPKQCQLQARLERAKYLLMLTDSSVTDVCMEAGFSSLGTFTYVFTRRVGMPPTVYRQRVRSMMNRAGEIPDQFIPGCFSLMWSG